MPKQLNPATRNLAGKRIGGGRYELISILGEGAYGVVYLSLDTTSPPDQPAWYAIKCLTKAGLDTRQRKFQRREIALHQLASNHSGVVTLHCVIEESDFIFVVLDFCPDGDLFAMITEHQMYLGNDELIRSVFLQIASAVEYCHDMGIHHRDLKPENILCRNGGANLLLADFGLATSEKTSEAFGCGSSFYMSPECQGGVYTKTPYSTRANDIWALGVILVNLTCGRNPWKQATLTDETFRAYVADPNFLRKILPVSVQTNELLKRIFCINPQHRITLPELRQTISKIKTFTMTEEELIHAHSAVKKVIVQQHVAPAPAKPAKAAAGKAFLANGGTNVKIVQVPSDREVNGSPRQKYPRTPVPGSCNFVVSPATPKISGDDQRHHRRPGSPYPPTNAVSPMSPYPRHQPPRTPNPNDFSEGSLTINSVSSSVSDGSLILTPEVQAIQDTPLTVVPGGDLDGGDWGNELEAASGGVVVTKAAALPPTTKSPGTPSIPSARGFLRDVVRKIRAL